MIPQAAQGSSPATGATSDRVQERISVLSGDLCLPVGFPAVAVDEAPEVGHAIDATDSPAGTGWFEAPADHIFAGTFDLSAANRAAFGETLGIRQMRNMIPQVVSQALQGFAAGRASGK